MIPERDCLCDFRKKTYLMTVGGGFWCDIRESIRVKVGYRFGVLDNSKIASISERTNALVLSIGYLF